MYFYLNCTSRCLDENLILEDGLVYQEILKNLTIFCSCKKIDERIFRYTNRLSINCQNFILDDLEKYYIS